MYRIELLNSNEQLALGPDGKLALVDEAHGKTHEVPLSSRYQAMKDDTITILWSDENRGHIANGTVV